MKRNLLKTLICATLAAALMLGAGTVGAGAAQIESGFVGAEEDAPQKEEEEKEDPGGLPSAYSSVDLGYVTSVKSQNYSTCWVFASLATFESALLRRGLYTEDMSTNHLNLWSTAHRDGTGWQRQVSSDGYPNTPLGYLTAWHGGVFQSEVADLPLLDSISSDDLDLGLAHYGVTGVRYLNRGENDVIKQCIMDYGGVYTSYANTVTCLSNDKINYYMPPNYTGSYIGHSVEVVGWDDNYPKENFKQVAGSIPSNNGAWLIKGSWGANNSLGGFFWLSYEDRYVFTKKYIPSYAFTDIEIIDDTKKLIQDEIYGATYEFLYEQKKSQTYINRFHFDTDFNEMDKVIFETRSVGASYSIYYVPDGEGETPDPDRAHWTKLGEGKTEYGGYICVDIENFAYPDETGSVAVTLDTQETDSFVSVGVSEWLGNEPDRVFINDSRYGDSFLFVDGQLTDLMKWYKDKQNDELGGTFVIKTITVKNYPPTLLGDANLDGVVNINDVTEIQRHVAEFLVLDKTAAANADFNQDGAITIEDATEIQMMLAEFS